MGDLQGRKAFKVFNQEFIVDERYQVTKELGQGAYGIVWYVAEQSAIETSAIYRECPISPPAVCTHCISQRTHEPCSYWNCLRPSADNRHSRSAATNIHTGEGVAVKKVTNVFSKKILAKRALREIKLLQHFRGQLHPC